jgi:hypothetical protein
MMIVCCHGGFMKEMRVHLGASAKSVQNYEFHSEITNYGCNRAHCGDSLYKCEVVIEVSGILCEAARLKHARPLPFIFFRACSAIFATI